MAEPGCLGEVAKVVGEGLRGRQVAALRCSCWVSGVAGERRQGCQVAELPCLRLDARVTGGARKLRGRAVGLLLVAQ